MILASSGDLTGMELGIVSLAELCSLLTLVTLVDSSWDSSATTGSGTRDLLLVAGAAS